MQTRAVLGLNLFARPQLPLNVLLPATAAPHCISHTLNEYRRRCAFDIDRLMYSWSFRQRSTSQMLSRELPPLLRLGDVVAQMYCVALNTLREARRRLGLDPALGGVNAFGELKWLGLGRTVAPYASCLALMPLAVNRTRIARCCCCRNIFPGNAKVTYSHSAIDSGGGSIEHDSGHLTLPQSRISPPGCSSRFSS